MNNRQTALNDLVKLADSQGYLMFDDISDRDENMLSILRILIG